MTLLGDAYVRVRPDTSKFESETKTSVLSSVKKIGLASAALLGGLSIGSAIADAFDAKDLNARLQAQLGLTAKEAGKAGKAAGDLYRDNFGGSLEEVNASVRSVVTDIGITMDSVDFKDVNAKVLTLADTFDQDLGGITRAVGQLMRTGLAANATDALDVITKGFQSGDDKAGDFLDTLNEYGTQFRKLGIDGKTATGLISQGLKAGARDGDIVADAIKEFSIRAIDGSKLTTQSFQALGVSASAFGEKVAKGGAGAKAALDETLTRLKNIKDPAERAAIATGLFGTQAEDLGDALFHLDVNGAADSMGKVAGAADGVVTAMGSTPSAKIEAFKRTVLGVAQDAAAAAIPVFDTIGSGLASVGGKLIDAVKESVKKGDVSPLTDAISTMTQDALDKASDKWTAVAYVKDLVEKLKKGTESGDWTAVGAALQDAIGDALSGASDLGKTIFDWVSMTLKKVKWFDLGIEAGKQVPAMLLGLALGILNFDPMPILIGLKDHWFDVVIAVLTLAFLPGKVVGAIAKVFSKVPFAGPLLEWLFRESVVISKRLVTFAGDLIGGFVRGLTGGGGRLTGFFRGIFEDIKLHLYVWGDDLLKFIKGVPDKLLNGSLQGMERLGTWYREAFTSLWGAVKAVFITGIALVIGIFLGFVGDLLDGAAKMLGWVPGIGPKLKAAAADFATFRDDVNSRLGGINDKDVEIRTKLISGEILSAAYKPGGSTYNSQVPEKARSIGGSVFGPGSSTSDSIPAMLSNGEHVWSAREVAKAGGHAAVAAMRSNVLHRAKGGPIGGDIGGSVPAGSEHGLFVKTSGLDANAFATTAEKFVDAQAEAFRKAQQKKADDNPAFAGGGGGSAAEVLLRHLGVPYSWGGGNTSGPTRGFAQGANTIGWDCSSYVQYGVFQALHKLIPRTAAAQQAALKATSGGPGQLVFYGRPAHHVAMMLGNGQMVEEPHTGASSRVTAFRPGTSYAMYDNGGYLQPGTDLQAVYNHTGKPEPVFTSDQWEILKGNLAGAGTTEVRVFIGDRDITDIVRSEVKRGTDGVATALRQGRR